MNSDKQGAPPSYEVAAASGSSAKPPNTHLEVPRVRNGIPALARRSMEDEARPLPPGWIRQFDSQSGHQYFVDTTATPPRSIWSHPYDDEQYLNSLDPEERRRVQTLHHPVPNKADIEAESSEDDGDHHHHPPPNKGAAASGIADPSSHASLPPRPVAEQAKGPSSFGRRLKDKLSGSTHEQREALRRAREEEERAIYERHQRFRVAMMRAQETGQPQFIGKGRDGKDVYIEPPQGAQMPPGAYGYNPYMQGPYGNPNATFVRPQYQYARPYGMGYGGGYGLPLAGGLMGGMMLGGMMF